VHVRVTDMEAAKRHYINTMGFYPMLEVGNKLYLKGWDEFDHHSIVLEEGGVGVAKVGFKVAKPDDIDVIESKSRTFGVETQRMTKGDNPDVSDGLRITLPSGHIVEVYHDQTYVGSLVGTVNPQLFPRELVGIGAPRIDHALLGCDDVNTTEKFFIDVFDFYQVERLIPDLDHQDCSLATWLSSGNRGHDIALIQGENYDKKLHHLAFQLEGWSDILKAGQIMSIDDVPIDMGPTQHGITRGKTIYYFDPSGNRNEVFADGYVAQRDRPTMLWTADQVARGINAINRTLNETFTTALT
jgi:catechol 2,3-dioxygenase